MNIRKQIINGLKDRTYSGRINANQKNKCEGDLRLSDRPYQVFNIFNEGGRVYAEIYFFDDKSPECAKVNLSSILENDPD
jgi:hypothetical protein